MRRRFGIITPTISPFKKGSIDEDAIKALLSFLKKSKVNGIFPCGSTGCAPLMDMQQHISMINAYSSENSYGIKMFPGIGRDSIRETLEVANAAIRADATALVLVTPYYMRMNSGEIIRYYDRLLGKIDFDVIAYNIPQLTGNKLDFEMFEAIRKRHRNLVGIKDSSMDFEGFSELCTSLPDDVMVFQGEDNLLTQSLMLGASGGICGTTNFDSSAVRLFKMYARKKFKGAMLIQERINGIMDTMSHVEFPIAYHYLFYKRIMHKETINALPPFYRNDQYYVRDVRKRLKDLI